VRALASAVLSSRRAQSDDRDIPSLGVPYPSPTLDSRVIVRALMMMPTKDDTDLNLREWAEACALSV
jgi:hypothetical protein